MTELNYTNVPTFFSYKYGDNVFKHYSDITIKWYLLNILSNCENRCKTKIMEDLAEKGFIITVNNKTETVHKSFKWIRKCYYEDLKDNLKFI